VAEVVCWNIRSEPIPVAYVNDNDSGIKNVMKGLVITGYGKIERHVAIQELEKPKVRENQVLVEVHAASVNPVDYKIVEGALRLVKRLDFPAPIGFDVAGVIVEKGPEVNHLEIGDEIYSRVPTDSPGTFAEFIAIDSNVVTKKPSNLSFEEASSIPLIGMTTFQGFELGELKTGDKILIHAGSGGVGTFAIQYAKLLGAYVYTTTSTGNVGWVKGLGADRVIDYKKENYLEIVKNIDFVYDTLGGKYTKEAFRVIREGGRVISIAGDVDEITAAELGLHRMIRLFLAIKRRKVERYCKEKSAFYRFFLMDPDVTQLETLRIHLENRSIRPVIDKVFQLNEASRALAYQKEGRAKGKIVIRVK
jgi:NADPH:quinone reductase-like Zn-dependent oxidoreductase